MAAEPPKPTRSSRTFTSEPPQARFEPCPTLDAQPVAALQNKLEKEARSEYALRHYDEVERILSELEISYQTAIPPNASGEQVVDGDFLMASILCLRGRLHSRMGSEEKARTDFVESVRLFEKHKSELKRQKASARISTDYGIALARIKRVKEALALLKRVCKSGAAPPEAYGYLGFACQHSGRLKQAVDAYRKGLQLTPDDPTLLRYLAETLAKAGKLEAVPAFCDAAMAAWRSDDLGAAQALAQRALELAPTDARALITAVNIVFARKDPDGAMAIVAGVLEHNPRHASALGLKGRLLRISGELNEAIKTLSAVDVETPDLAWVLVDLASVLHQRDAEHDAEALELLDRASGLNPQDARAPYEQARIRLDHDEIDKAVTALDRAVKIEPQSAFLHCELGRILLRSGLAADFARAREAFDAALLLDPKSTMALSGKAHILRREGRLEQALDLLRRAFHLAPGDNSILEWIIDLLLEQGLAEEALEELESEIRRNPQSITAYSRKGRILRDQKDLNGAARAFLRAAELDPGNPDLVGDLAETFRRLDQYDMAGNAYDHLLRLQPESIYAMGGKALYLSEIASFQQASDLLDRALEKAPREAWLWGLQGWCLENLGKTFMARAREAYEQALSAGDDFWYRKGLANTLCQLGLEDEASIEFERIIREQKKKTRDDAQVLGALGWCHYRLRRYDEAVRLLHAALSVDDEPHVQFDLALTLLACSRSTLALSEYQRAAELTSKRHILRQRGLYYIALYDLVEAASDESFGPEADDVFELLRDRLAASGVALNELSWLGDRLPGEARS